MKVSFIADNREVEITIGEVKFVVRSEQEGVRVALEAELPPREEGHAESPMYIEDPCCPDESALDQELLSRLMEIKREALRQESGE